jgi:hypothetical protein
MSKIGIFGILALFGSMILFTFELIGKAMDKTGANVEAMSLADIIGQENCKWIANLDFGFAKSLLEFIFNDPLYLPLLALGIILLVISGFVKK